MDDNLTLIDIVKVHEQTKRESGNSTLSVVIPMPVRKLLGADPGSVLKFCRNKENGNIIIMIVAPVTEVK